MDQHFTRRIVILGQTGTGKSSLCNTLFGEKVFKESHSANSETHRCQSFTKTINGRNIQLVDTPGFFDTDGNELKSELLRCIVESAPGPHAFLLVFRTERFTEQEEEIVNKMVHEYFDENVLKYTTVVFTYGDELAEGMKIEEWMKGNKPLKNLLEKCQNRCCVFDNKHWNNNQDLYRNNQNQIKKLLEIIEQTVNYNASYINKMLQMVQQQKEKKDQLRRSQQENKTMRIVLLGKHGTGKSSLCNTLFGEKVFKESSLANSVTHRCQSFTKTIDGRNIQLIDTPSFFNTDKSNNELKSELLRCIVESAPGPHAFLLLFQIGRFTPQEEEIVNLMENEYFGEVALKYTTVVFTRGDDLDEGMKIEDWVKKNESVKNLLKKCQNRCCVFDNRYWNNNQDQYRNNQIQIKKLLEIIDQTVRENREDHYTNEMLKEVQKKIEEKKAQLRRSSPNMSEKERSQKAKESDCSVQ